MTHPIPSPFATAIGMLAEAKLRTASLETTLELLGRNPLTIEDMRVAVDTSFVGIIAKSDFCGMSQVLIPYSALFHAMAL